MRRRVFATLAAATLSIGCGGSEPEPAAPGPTTTAGGAAPTARADVAEHLESVDVRLEAPSPVGIVPADEAPSYPLHIVVMNEGSQPLELADSMARVAVERDGRIVCEDPDFGAVELLEELSPVIAPGGEVALEASLPCGLEEVADYDVIADVIFAGDREDVGVPAPTDPHESASLRIAVSEHEPPFERQRPTLAEVPEGHPSP